MPIHELDGELTDIRHLSEIGEHLAKHIVALVLTVETSEGPQQAVYSGFLLRHNGMEYWITAGHILSEIKDILERSDIVVKTAAWLDGHDVPGAELRPVDLQSLLRFEIDTRGLDIGFVPLRDYEIKHIDASKIKDFLTDDDVRIGPRTLPNAFFVVGFPGHAHSPIIKNTSDGWDINASTYAICVPAALFQPPEGSEGEFWNATPCYWLKALEVPDNVGRVICHYRGLSGSPVFAAYRRSDQRLAYTLVGVQSACSDMDPMCLRIVDIHFVIQMIDVVWRTAQLSKKLDHAGIFDHEKRRELILQEIRAVVSGNNK